MAQSTSARYVVLLLLAGLLITVAILSLGIGAVAIPATDVLAILLEPLGLGQAQVEQGHVSVLLDIRAPRVLLGLLVGAGLAITGATIQGLFRNPLADPGLIGVLAVLQWQQSASLFWGDRAKRHERLVRAYTLPLSAFLGSLAVTVLVYRLANINGRTDMATLLLAGIAINALMGAVTGLLTYAATDAQLRTLTFWSMGSLGNANWTQIITALPLLLVPMLLLPLFAPSLNAILLGEAEAGHLGFNLERTKRMIVVLVAVIVGTAVALTGVIGFVGLVVPHLLRLAMGPDHHFLLPGSALLGATLVLAADLLARTVVAPAELPLGIITALIGGPFFLWLLLRYRNRSF